VIRGAGLLETLGQRAKPASLVDMEMRILRALRLLLMHVRESTGTQGGARELIVTEGYERHGRSMARNAAVMPASEFTKRYCMAGRSF
jgi:hypothetical protein